MMVILLRGHPPESTSINARIALDIGEEEEEDGRESNGSDANLDDYDMEDYWQSRLMSYEILPSTVLVSTLWLFCIFHWHSHL
jgi:hypothetical protein